MGVAVIFFICIVGGSPYTEGGRHQVGAGQREDAGRRSHQTGSGNQVRS